MCGVLRLTAPAPELRRGPADSSRQWALPILQHLLVEHRHQFRRRPVAHALQAHHDERGARVTESSRQPDQPFTSDLDLLGKAIMM
jgi:hypothetical protein